MSLEVFSITKRFISYEKRLQPQRRGLEVFYITKRFMSYEKRLQPQRRVATFKSVFITTKISAKLSSKFKA
jgi:hypothetical protein